VKVYVAASSKEIARAEQVIAELRKLGVEITHDWTAVMRKHPPDSELEDDVLLPELERDLIEGVKGADLVLVLAPRTPSTGVWVELGAAWGLLIEVHSAGDLTLHPWLRLIATTQHASDERAIGAVAELVRAWKSESEAGAR